ncbi:AAA family ATPase [Pseudemcibacter aquimaris]|uniref:AAA family ATPase n=1 Tax=Pseudemcibacter aquimaris TaxID=2857064 RepID=UPI002010E594|nr:AAA family ATPase [Pseudemcibacter aquimaris]MCC3862641.1 AAA family ATPase [Pseudemcibacter aquimaris]WDU57881.1 AAA family ATPase [Pseudemcibacter aquimaris]
MQAPSPTSPWFDFNSANDQIEAVHADLPDRKAPIKAQLLGSLEGYLHQLLPAGSKKHGRFVVGDTSGSKGQSLSVDLTGSKAGMWHDFATGEGGDVFDLFASVWGLNTHHDFGELLQRLEDWLGIAPVRSSDTKPTAPIVDELGAYSAKWDYLDADGQLLACVYRYDTEAGKEFRPWDVQSRKMKAPDIRPLYNLPEIVKSGRVILVEGEKCADALGSIGIAATTAMFGAKAPLDKTDWSPLKGKQVIIWPDHDEAGRVYAQKLLAALPSFGVASVTVLSIPAGKPEKWDAADAVAEGFDVPTLLEGDVRPAIPSFALEELIADKSPMPADLVAPRVMTPGSILVFGGAPKVGKSDFLLSWFIHLAAGEDFLGMSPSGALKIFYFQAEVQYHYLRERVQTLAVSSDLRARAGRNLILTPQLRLLLNSEGVEQLARAILSKFPDGPDIIAIDPIRNVFDGGSDGGGENDNAAMMFFLTERVERLAKLVNPDAAVILVHHTRKLPKKQLEEDPFQALSGASAMRGFYSSGLLLFRPDESRTERNLYFELRNGPALPYKLVDKLDGRWMELDKNSERLVNQDYGEKLDAERRRKHDVILQILFEEAKSGRVYTMNQFCQAFENSAGLGGETTIRRRLDVLSTKGYIKFFRDAEQYGIAQSARTKYGFMCVEDMRIAGEHDVVDPETGEVTSSVIPVLPSHYKCRSTAAALPVEDPQIWIYYEEGNP